MESLAEGSVGVEGEILVALEVPVHTILDAGLFLSRKQFVTDLSALLETEIRDIDEGVGWVSQALHSLLRIYWSA